MVSTNLGGCGRKVELYHMAAVLVILPGDCYTPEGDLFSCRKQGSDSRENVAVARCVGQ